MALRPTTNLVVPSHLQLPKKELKQGFMYVYNKGYKGSEATFINSLWLSSFFPEIANNPTFGQNKKGIRLWAEHASKNLKAGYLRLQKVNDQQDPHFIASVPIAEFNRYGAIEAAQRYASWFTGAMASGIESANALQDQLKTATDREEGPQARTIPGEIAIRNIANLDAVGRVELTKTLLNIRLSFMGP